MYYKFFYLITLYGMIKGKLYALFKVLQEWTNNEFMQTNER